MDREQDDTTHKESDASVTSLVSVEELIEQSIGPLNGSQVFQAILASIPSFFDSQQTFISIFAEAQPKWHCNSTFTTCTSSSNICNLSRTEWAWDSGTATHTSIISEWDLECATSFISSFPSTCYFVGCLLGGLVLATLGDSSLLGRKNLLFGSSLLMCLFALVTSLSPNVWVYSGLRFLTGVGRAPIAISALVLLTERVGKRWRPQVAMVGFISFSLGILALAGIAYATRDLSWRSLYMFTSIPGILCCIVSYFFLYESPRWLFMQGRVKEAMVILKKLGSSSTSTNQIFPSSSPSISQPLINNQPPNTSTNNPFVSVKTLVKRRWAVQRLLISMMLSFGIGLIYFGMFLGVGNLGLNIYLTSAFNSLLSLSSYLVTFLYWLQKCNRRSSILGFCIISGAISIVFSVLRGADEGVIIGLELVSLFCASMAYNLVLMYTVELFPTCVRNTASSLVRQAMILGSAFAPMLVLLGKTNRVYSYGVFGLAMLLSGFLVVFLPETKGKVLCDTMEEQELSDYMNEVDI